MKMRQLALSAVLAVTTTACFKATFVQDRNALSRPVTHEEWTHHYAWGIVGNEDYDVREWCDGGAGMVRTGGNVGTTFATIFTLGIYAPRKIYVTCDEEMRMSKAEVAR